MTVEAPAPPRPYTEISADIEAAEAELNGFFNRIERILEDTPDSLRDAWQDLVFSIEETEDQDDPAGSRVDRASDFEEQHPELRGLTYLLRQAFVAEDQVEELRRESLPHERELLTKKAGSLLSKLDYDKLAEDLDGPEGGGWIHELSTVVATARALDQDVELTPSQIDTLSRHTDETRKKLVELGFERENPDGDEAVTIDPDTINNSAAQWRQLAEESTAQLNARGAFPSSYGHRIGAADSSVGPFNNKALNILGNEVASEPDPFDFTRVEVPDELIQAVIRRAEQIVHDAFDPEKPAMITDLESDAFQNWQKEAEATTTESVMEKLEITGMAALSRLFPELDEAKVTEIIKSIPPQFLRYVKSIEFLNDKQTSEAIENLGLNQDSFGDYDLDTGHVRISIPRFISYWSRRDEELSSLKSGPDSEARIDNLVKFAVVREMALTLNHEIAHGVHSSLPAALLDIWQNAVDKEQVSFSNHVRDSRKQDVFLGNQEDFAETMALFTLHPRQVLLGSPARYEAMTEIFKHSRVPTEFWLKHYLLLKISRDLIPDDAEFHKLHNSDIYDTPVDRVA